LRRTEILREKEAALTDWPGKVSVQSGGEIRKAWQHRIAGERIRSLSTHKRTAPKQKENTHELHDDQTHRSIECHQTAAAASKMAKQASEMERKEQEYNGGTLTACKVKKAR
jgi:hypothetical protein